MIMRFNPNETVVNGFRRVAQASRSKIKLYLLKRAGFSSHDIRLVTNSDKPLRVSDPYPMQDFFYHHLFQRSVDNTGFHVLNASGTSPVILEMHFFLSIPDGIPLYNFNIEESGERLTKVYSKRKSFIEESEDDEHKVFSLPVLEKGKVMPIPDGSFGLSVAFEVDSDTRHKLSNDKSYYPSNDLIQRCDKAFDEFLNQASVWVGLVLDNEELLPYRWDYQAQRFEPGFFTDATVVST